MTDARFTRERQTLVASARHLAAAGLSPGSSGNLSLRIGDEILITPTGSSLSRVTPDDLAIVATDGSPRPGPRASKEIPLHLAIYTKSSDARAVVHLHSPAATALACLRVPAGQDSALPNLTPYRVMRLGTVPTAEYAPPGSAALGDGVRVLADDNPVILLANHGAVTVGANLDTAVDLAEELESAAQLALTLRGVPAVELAPADVSRLRSL